MYEGELIGTEDPVPAPQPKPAMVYVFHEQRSRVYYYYKGILIMKGSAWCNGSAKNQCIQSGIEAAQQACTQYQVNKESEMVIEVHLFTCEVRKTKCRPEPWDRPGTIRYEQVGHNKKIKREIVWTSREGRLEIPREVTDA